MLPDGDVPLHPGECPLCSADVPCPTAEHGIVPILAQHFGTTCAATRFTDPATA